MSGYIGGLGAMVPVICPAEQTMDPTREMSLDPTLGGRRFAVLAPRPFRSWVLHTTDVESPTDLAPLQEFAAGAWGTGPWRWLSPWAVKVNVLTPAGSVLEYAALQGGAVAGPVQAVDGTWFPVSVVSPAGGVNGVARSRIRTYSPIPAGTTYTASLYLSAGQNLRVQEYGTDVGAVIVSRTSPASAAPGLARVAVTATATSSTAALRLDVQGAGTCAGAAISFTSTAQPWGVGDGCEQVIVRDNGMAVTSLSWEPWGGASFEILEVGG